MKCKKHPNCEEHFDGLYFSCDYSERRSQAWSYVFQGIMFVIFMMVTVYVGIGIVTMEQRGIAAYEKYCDAKLGVGNWVTIPGGKCVSNLGLPYIGTCYHCILRENENQTILIHEVR